MLTPLTFVLLTCANPWTWCVATRAAAVPDDSPPMKAAHRGIAAPPVAPQRHGRAGQASAIALLSKRSGSGSGSGVAAAAVAGGAVASAGRGGIAGAAAPPPLPVPQGRSGDLTAEAAAADADAGEASGGAVFVMPLPDPPMRGRGRGRVGVSRNVLGQRPNALMVTMDGTTAGSAVTAAVADAGSASGSAVGVVRAAWAGDSAAASDDSHSVSNALEQLAIAKGPGRPVGAVAAAAKPVGAVVLSDMDFSEMTMQAGGMCSSLSFEIIVSASRPPCAFPLDIHCRCCVSCVDRRAVLCSHFHVTVFFVHPLLASSTTVWCC